MSKRIVKKIHMMVLRTKQAKIDELFRVFFYSYGYKLYCGYDDLSGLDKVLNKPTRYITSVYTRKIC